MGEGGGRGGVGQVICRHVDSLHGGDRAFLGGSTVHVVSKIHYWTHLHSHALLHTTHIRGESGLVSDGRRDTTEQGRHLKST